MQTVVNALAQRAAARALLLAFVVLSVAFYLAPIQVEVAALFYVGLLAPALGIAAMAGFIAWNWRVFWILLGAGFLVTAFVVVGAARGRAGQLEAPFPHVHFRRCMIARPITQSLSLSLRKLSSSVNWVMRWR